MYRNYILESPISVNDFQHFCQIVYYSEVKLSLFILRSRHTFSHEVSSRIRRFGHETFFQL